LTDKYLKVMKVAPKADIPFQEYAFAENLSDGRLAVPLVGYPVSYSFEEKQLNSNNEETNTVMLMPTDKKASAQFVKVSYGERTEFDALKKIDVFPVAMLEGEWYYAETVVSASEADNQNVGSVENQYSRTPVSKVSFARLEDSINAVKVDIDESIDKTKIENLAPILKIPATAVKYRAARTGTETALREEDVPVHWQDAELVKINFAGLWSSNNSDRDNQLVNLEIADDYIGFTLLKPQAQKSVRYAFYKRNKGNYDTRTYFWDDHKKFGYFSTMKPIIRAHEIYRQSDLEARTFLNRFNPKKGEIVFHFSINSPNWARPAARVAIQEWDKAFMTASGIHIRLDETLDVQVGDPRYNTINLYEAIAGSGGLLGFGPSLHDATTGEIISATTNIHLTEIRTHMIGFLRNYIMREVGMYESNSISLQSKLASVASITESPAGASLLASESLKLSSELEALQSEAVHFTDKEASYQRDSVLSDDDKALKGWLASVGVETSGLRRKSDLDHALKGLGMSNRGQAYKYYNTACTAQNQGPGSVNIGYMEKVIKEECPFLDDYIGFLRGLSVSHTEEEFNVIDQCSYRLMQTQLKNTLLHEIGHNFGLRHNFAGSLDKANFLTPEQAQSDSQIVSSSVMEYKDSLDKGLNVVGPYDIAAIRYGYAGKVEVQNMLSAVPSITELDENKSISAQLASGTKLKKYLYCTDEDFHYNLDPICLQRDSGTNPLEIAEHIISDYWQDYILLNFRYERRNSVDPQGLLEYHVGQTFLRLKRIYDEWRFRLDKLASTDTGYTKYLDHLENTEKLAELSKSTPELRDWYAASRRIVDFLMTVATRPSRYCVAPDSTGELRMASLYSVRKRVYQETQKSIRSCVDKEALDVLKQENANQVKEIGFYENSFRYSMDLEDIDKPLDVVGFDAYRQIAFMVLSFRDQNSPLARHADLFPSMLDEPEIRSKVLDWVLDRIGNGVEMEGVEKRFPKFKRDQEFLVSLIQGYKAGIGIPESTEGSLDRRKPFDKYVASAVSNLPGDPNDPNDPYVRQKIGSSWVAAHSEENPISAQLILAYRDIVAMSVPGVPQEVIELLVTRVQEFEAILPEKAKLSEMTIGKLLELQISLEQILTNIEYFSLTEEQGGDPRLMAGFERNQAVLGQIVKKVGMDKLIPIIQNPEAENELKDKLVVELLENAESINAISLTKEDLSEVTAKFRKFAEANMKDNPLFKEYSRNRSDYDAQRDIIVEFLMR